MGKKAVKITFAYWGIVLKRALHIVWIETEMKGLVISTVLVFIVACSLFITSQFGTISSDLVTQAWQQALLQGMTALCAVGIFIFVLLFVFAYIPAKMHEDRSEHIQKLENQIAPDIKLHLFPYVPNPNAEGDKWVGVKIINKSGVRSIERCKAKLFAVDNFPGTPIFFGSEQLPADLQWSSNNLPDVSGFLTIPREGEVSLDIARSRNHYQEGSFTLTRGDNFLNFSSGSYKVIFRIDGAIHTHENGLEKTIDIPPQQYSATIVLHAGFNLRIEDIQRM